MSESYQGRAKQFLPYAALRGFEEIVNEKRKIKQTKRIPSEEEETLISQRLSVLSRGREVSAELFSDGEYVTVRGIVGQVDFALCSFTLNGRNIYFSDVYDIYFNDEEGDGSLSVRIL